MHTLLDLGDNAYRLIRDRLVKRKTLFEHVRALSYYHCFESWSALMDFMMRGLEIGPYDTASFPPALRPSSP